MKRTVLALLVAVMVAGVCMGVAGSASAQFGGLIPIMLAQHRQHFSSGGGRGSVAYEQTDKQGRKSTMEMSVVGKEMVGTQEAYWMEMGHASADSATLMYGKSAWSPRRQILCFTR